MSQQWYIRTKHGEKGPFSLRQLQGYVDAAVLRPQSSVRSQQGVWIAAGTVPELTFASHAPASQVKAVTTQPKTQASSPPASQASKTPDSQSTEANTEATSSADQVSSSISELLSPVHQELQSLREQTAQLVSENQALREKFLALRQQLQTQTELIDRLRDDLEQRGQTPAPVVDLPAISKTDAGANQPTLRALGLSASDDSSQSQTPAARLATTLGVDETAQQHPQTQFAEPRLASTGSWRDRREQAGDSAQESPVLPPSNRWRVNAEPSPELTEVDHATLARMRHEVLTHLMGPAEASPATSQAEISVDSFSTRTGRDFTTMVTNGLNRRDFVGTNDRRLLRSELLLYSTHHDSTAARFLSAAGQAAFQHAGNFGIGTVLKCEQMPGWEAEQVLCDGVILMSTVASDTQPLVSEDTPGVALQLYWVVPCSRAEAELIETEGLHKWMSLFQNKRMSPFFDLTRPCNVKRKHWFRR